jgi:colanic acid/amylovoran biosynthesis glycosyltransferase
MQSGSASIQTSVQETLPVVFLPNFDFWGSTRKIREVVLAIREPVPAGKWSIRDRSLLRALARLQPDLIHFHFGTLAVMLARYPQALGIPFSLSLRGSDIQVMPLQDARYAANLCDVIHRAVGIHSVCHDLVHVAHHHCNDMPEVSVIRTCVPLHDTPAVFLEKPGLRLVSVGRLHWRKGYPDLVRAMVYLPDASLDIVGDGPDHEFLLYLIHSLNLQTRVRVLGKLPFEEFVRVLEQATAYVQSSIAEGFSNALAEAMALGKAVFATDVGGTGEVIGDGLNGIILPMGNPQGIAEKLALARDGALMKCIGTAARQTAQETFSKERHAKEFYEFYWTCVHEH